MTEEKLRSLRVGDIVRSRFDRSTYIVTGNYGNRITAVTTRDITNASDWELVERSRVLPWETTQP